MKKKAKAKRTKVKPKAKKLGRPFKKKTDKGTRYGVYIDAETNKLWKRFVRQSEYKNNSVAICTAMKELMSHGS